MPEDNRDELFEIFDENGKAIGTEKRGIVHSKGLWHRGLYVIVRNRAGDIFIQKRSAKKDLYPGRLDVSVAGHLSPGESYDDAAVREAREELGVELINLKEIGEFRHRFNEAGRKDNEINKVFCSSYSGTISPDPDEIESGEWVSMIELDSRIESHPGLFVPWISKVIGFLKK